MTPTVFPDDRWLRKPPSEAGIDMEKLERARRWLDERAGDGCYRDARLTFGRYHRGTWRDEQATNARYRVVIVRGGAVVAEWNRGVDPGERLPMFSAVKALYSSLLGIAIEEGRIASVDDQVVDCFPEFMDVPPGMGPKPGRYAFEKDREITFRQLISNTSGYLKPGEEPGRVFHYQTEGMNIVTHAVARTYGLYDLRYPAATPGCGQLIDEKIGQPIGANWIYHMRNFDLPRTARTEVFGYYTDLLTNALDLARLGWLWRNWGRWKDKQLIPEAWLREATQTAPDIRANCPLQEKKYGYAFWTNDQGQLLPDLPRDSYVAAGRGGIALVWVCPSLDLVVAHNPGLLFDRPDESENSAPGLLRLIADACGLH